MVKWMIRPGRTFSNQVGAMQMFTVGITGYLQVFPALSMEKDCKNHREETLYSSKRKLLRMLWGNPVIFTDCRETP
jgi:hypothetical protein